MKQGMKADVLRLDDGTLFGFDLSSDYCSEHEWGLKFTKVFGLNSKANHGLDRRQISKIPDESSSRILEHFIIEKDEKLSYLIFDYARTMEHIKLDRNRYNLVVNDYKTNVGSAWDENSFGIVTNKYHDELKELHKAFLNKDIVLGLFGGGVFENAGLKILIASRVPKSISKDWCDSDKNVEALDEESKKTKIHSVLEKAGKTFHALSPAWVSEIEDAKTIHKVVYWLNPKEQKKYSHGWFTVEDLEDWSNDTGNVIKKDKK
jgi:hypothetical protein